MTALLSQSFSFNITESEAYELIKFNFPQLQIASGQVKGGYNVAKLEDIKRLLGLGLVLKVKAPSWKENELYKLVEKEWELFSSLGTKKDFTPSLSYRSVVYILQLYGFPLRENNNKQVKVPIHRVTSTEFKYTEEESLTILKNNKAGLEKSSGTSVYELTNTSALSKLLKVNLPTLYTLLKYHMAELELLGCSKTTRYNITYRGVLFLLLDQDYPVNLTLEVDVSTSKVVYLNAKKEQVSSSVSYESKPDIELLKSFFSKRREELKAKAIEDKNKADSSYEKLTIANDAYWHLEQAEEYLSLL